MLVIKTTTNVSVTHFRPRQDYPEEQEALRSFAEEIFTALKSADRPDINYGDFAHWALCEQELLEIEGTDLNQDISIVNGRVVNAKAE